MAAALLCACGSDSDNKSKEKNTTGSYQPHLTFPLEFMSAETGTSNFADIDCDATGISTFEFLFTTGETSHGPRVLDCNADNVIISQIPVGSGIRVYVYAYTEDKKLIFQGFGDTDISADQVTQGEEIAMTPIGDTETDTDTNTETDTDTSTETDTNTQQERFTNRFGMTFVRIEPGEFTMGSSADESGRYESETQHRMTITRPYYMQITEVTKGQWDDVSNYMDPSYFENCGRNCPVENTSWETAWLFIDQLNMQDSGFCTYRLPTEAEWEYAARAGSDTTFANGSITVTDCSIDPILDNMGWYCANSFADYEGCVEPAEWEGDFCGGIQPVAQKEPNAWGLYDMHGNVFEWCQDYFDVYPENPEPDYAGPDTGDRRTLRGGGWDSSAAHSRSATRAGAEPDAFGSNSGFRLVCEPNEQGQNGDTGTDDDSDSGEDGDTGDDDDGDSGEDGDTGTDDDSDPEEDGGTGTDGDSDSGEGGDTGTDDDSDSGEDQYKIIRLEAEDADDGDFSRRTRRSLASGYETLLLFEGESITWEFDNPDPDHCSWIESMLVTMAYANPLQQSSPELIYFYLNPI